MKNSPYMDGGRFTFVHEDGKEKAVFNTSKAAFGINFSGDEFKVYFDEDAAKFIEDFENKIRLNTAAQQALTLYWNNNLAKDGAFYAFADVTHDGVDELFHLVKLHDDYTDVDYAYFEVYMQKDGEITKIDSGAYTQNPSVLEHYKLYYENEKAYIIYRYYTGRQGGLSSSYQIYSFDENGEKVIFKSQNVGGLVENLTDADYAKAEQIEREYEEYRNNSATIIDEFYGTLNVGGWW